MKPLNRPPDSVERDLMVTGTESFNLSESHIWVKPLVALGIIRVQPNHFRRWQTSLWNQQGRPQNWQGRQKPGFRIMGTPSREKINSQKHAHKIGPATISSCTDGWGRSSSGPTPHCCSGCQSCGLWYAARSQQISLHCCLCQKPLSNTVLGHRSKSTEACRKGGCQWEGRDSERRCWRGKWPHKISV